MGIELKDRIFYTDDMANLEGWGTISNKKDDGWGLQFTVSMDDGRVFRSLYSSMFEKSIGQRFKCKKQVREERSEQLNRFNELYGKDCVGRV